MRGMAALLTNGPNDPPPIQRTPMITFKVRLSGSQLTGVTAIQPSKISAVIPGSGAFTSMRFIKFSCWGATGETPITATFPSSSVEQDQGKFEDYGVAGSRRPSLHMMPPFGFRTEWFSLTSSTDILQITGVTILDVTVCVRLQPGVEPTSY
jgi:hypothetical protein